MTQRADSGGHGEIDTRGRLWPMAKPLRSDLARIEVVTVSS